MNRIKMIRALTRVLGWLPLPVNHALGASLGTLLWLIPNRQRATGRKNLARCLPELETRERERLLRKNLRELGKSVTELGVLWNISDGRLRRLVRGMEGEDIWQEAHKKKRLYLVAVPHLGSFEALNLYTSRTLKLRVLYRKPRQPELESLLLEGRKRFGAELIRADRRGLIQLFRSASPSDVIAILPDQVPKQGQGVEAPFFDQPAQTMVLFAKLVQRLDPVVVLAYAERLSWGRGYRLHFRLVTGSVGDSDAKTAATALNQNIELAVRGLPDQYQWTYTRFGHS